MSQSRRAAPAALLALALLLPASAVGSALDSPAESLPIAPLARDATRLALAGDAAGLVARLAPPAPSLAGALAYGLDLRASGSALGLAAPEPIPPLPVATSHPLTAAVGAAYATFGLPAMEPARIAQLHAQEDRLDGRFAAEAAGLVVSLASHHALTLAAWSRLTPAQVRDVGALVTQPPRERGPEDISGAAALLRALDQDTLLASAGRVAQAADDVALAMRAAPAAERAGGFLFADPFRLILIGDAGANVYDGNVAPLPTFEPFVNVLTLDLGGDDLYLNNAGGAGAGIALCPLNVGAMPHGCGYGTAAAAAVDLAGDDTYYNDQESEGAQVAVQMSHGSSFLGIGVLRDLAGNDTYTAIATPPATGNQVAQGCSLFGVGLLVDDAGADRYTALEHDRVFSRQWAHGGGAFGGVGVLLDGDGDDAYLQQADGIDKYNQYGQGVGDLLAAGALLDLAGDDVVEVRQSIHPAAEKDGDMWVQGMGLDGVGVIVDLAGDDAYVVDQDIEQFGGIDAQGTSDDGVGILLDGGGNDVYFARQVATTPAAFFAQGAGGRVVSGLGLGLLADLGGNDAYTMEQVATDDARLGGQGMGDLTSVGILLDRGGVDAYNVRQVVARDAQLWAQGAGFHGAGALLDLGEEGDAYVVTQEADAGRLFAHGAGEFGAGVLVDQGGADRFTATQSATPGKGALRAQGAGESLGTGVLLNLGGDDVYKALAGAGAEIRAQGGASCGFGILVDAGGRDAYSTPLAADDAAWSSNGGGSLGLDTTTTTAPGLAALALPDPSTWPCLDGVAPCPPALPVGLPPLPAPCGTEGCIAVPTLGDFCPPLPL